MTGKDKYGKGYVFPTPVGMSPHLIGGGLTERSVPHARGDEPQYHPRRDRTPTCSPRPWG